MKHQQVPEEAKKVFEGEIFNVYQWQQEMFDGSYERFERITRNPVVTVIATNQEGQILIIEQEQPSTEPFFTVPGGRTEAGEDMQNSAERELKEETGYSANSWKLYRHYEGKGKVIVNEYCYLVTDLEEKQEEQELDPGERIKLKWVSFEEFLQYARKKEFRCNPSLRAEMVEALLEKEIAEEFKKELGVT